MAGFVGTYLQTDSSERYFIVPGTLVIVAEALPEQAILRNDGTSFVPNEVALRVFLPENIWYEPTGARTRQRPGWHDIIRPYARMWLELTGAERIQRACGEALGLLRQCVPADEDTTAAIQQFERIRALVQTSTDEQQRLDARREPLLAAFDSWIRRQAHGCGLSPLMVLRAVREHIDTSEILNQDGPPVETPIPAIENRQRRKIRISRSSE
jgi:hypothetical protein